MEGTGNDMQEKMPNVEYIINNMGRISGSMSHC
jgi:hypothetical protein